MTFARDAWPFVLPPAAAGALLMFFGLWGWGSALLVVALLVLLFFRDPARRFDGDARIVVAPADGLVTRVDVVENAAVGPGRFHRVVTFLSVFDVHVQKTPCEGEVAFSLYTRGRKVAAFRADAGEINEKHLTVIRRPDGDRVGVLQIAGLLARRIVCTLTEGDEVRRGQPMGLIKFGSRVDLLVPESYSVRVKKGDRVKNGATPMAAPPGTPEVSS